MAKLQERLEKTIELSPFDTKIAFHRAFATLAEERDLAGRSNPVFYRHLSGMGRPPSTDWLRVFADVGRVRWEWLATGVGGVTEAHERERRSADTEAAADVLDAIRLRFGNVFAVPGFSVWGASVRALTDYIVSGASDGADATPEQRGQVTDAVLDWLQTNVRRIPVTRPMPVELMNGFMSSLCNWGILLLSYGHHGLTLEEATRRLFDAPDDVPLDELFQDPEEVPE